ncbi:MAG: GTP cyclohydrolase I FolE [Planctomycetota bacterium]|nr:GTP cyclohydrolase I FolE [Planctomycetota bacterium]MEC9047888.1 GTP cyclohydrolase I FolE [Planctomycetota bacterium]
MTDLLAPKTSSRPAQRGGAHTRPSRDEAVAAIRTLLKWIGEDPEREGLIETPDRVLRAYSEFFAGYEQDPAAVLSKTFDESGSYNGAVIVRDIDVRSHCEHHMVPFIGKAHVAYLPDAKVVGISKLARLVNGFARRLQIQERLTAEVARTLMGALKPRGVAVIIEAEHHCMTMRGIRNAGATTVTQHLCGVYEEDPALRGEILRELRRTP